MDADVALELGLDQLPKETADAILLELAEQANLATLRRALVSLSGEQRTELERLTAAGDAAATQRKLLELVPNYAQLAFEETVRLKRVMLTESPAERELTAAGQVALDQVDQHTGPDTPGV